MAILPSPIDAFATPCEPAPYAPYLQSAQTSIRSHGTVAGGRQLAADYLNQGRAMVIDMSGNIWVAGDGGSTSNLVTEIVGSAVPDQPYARGLSNGRFQTVP
jgi:hypothetical protein